MFYGLEGRRAPPSPAASRSFPRFLPPGVLYVSPPVKFFPPSRFSFYVREISLNPKACLYHYHTEIAPRTS